METVSQTATQTGDAPPRPKAGLPVPDAQRSEAMLRLAAYFRSVGLRDHDTIHRLVGEVLDKAFAHAQVSAAEGVDLLGAAMAEATARTNRWLDALLAAAGATPSPNDSRGILLLRLRPLLGHHPDAYGRTDAFPAPMLAVARAGGRQVVPPVVRTEMDPQAIGELPMMLEWSTWRRWAERLRATGRSIAATLGGR